MRRLALAFLVVAAVGTAHAEAITVREVIELSKTGLSDEVLLALIEIEPQVFPVDPETLKALKQGRVSDRVITALVRHRRTTPVEPRDPAPDPAAPPEPQPAPQPQVVVIDHRDEHVREVPVAVPLYVPVLVHAPRHRDGQVVTPVQVFAPSIGLVHSRLGLSPPPPTPTSDPPHWHRYAPLPRRSDPPYWKKSPYLK